LVRVNFGLTTSPLQQLSNFYAKTTKISTSITRTFSYKFQNSYITYYFHFSPPFPIFTCNFDYLRDWKTWITLEKQFMNKFFTTLTSKSLFAINFLMAQINMENSTGPKWLGYWNIGDKGNATVILTPTVWDLWRTSS